MWNKFRLKFEHLLKMYTLLDVENATQQFATKFVANCCVLWSAFNAVYTSMHQTDQSASEHITISYIWDNYWKSQLDERRPVNCICLRP